MRLRDVATGYVVSLTSIMSVKRYRYADIMNVIQQLIYLSPSENA